ncbi:MAG: hypothetical protein ACR2HG_08615 [Pyrinomonadaceae bacterium]
MKWFILLALILLLAMIIASRYRRQIQMAIYFFQMFRKMRRMNKTDEKQIETKQSAENVPLVRCSRCGTWSPQDRAIKLRSGLFYCSKNCLETAAKIN